MIYTEKMLMAFNESNDFTTTFKLMLKLGGTIITTQDADDFQYIYAVGARETVVYKFYRCNIFDRAIKPYGTSPTMCTSGIHELLAKLCAVEHLTITIHTQ